MKVWLKILFLIGFGRFAKKNMLYLENWTWVPMTRVVSGSATGRLGVKVYREKVLTTSPLVSRRGNAVKTASRSKTRYVLDVACEHWPLVEKVVPEEGGDGVSCGTKRET